MKSSRTVFATFVCIVTGLIAYAGITAPAQAQIIPPATSQPVMVQPAPMQPVAAVPPAEPIVIDATNVMAQSMTMPGGGIPRSLLAEAQAVAIIPNMIRGAFVLGVQHGRGVLLLRDAQNGWQPPRMVQINGGSIGYQIGVQSADLVLIFRTPQSVQNLLSRTIKIGVDASAAAGPVGRTASAATDLPLRAEILSYSRSRGAFIGVSIDGSSISLDPANEVGYYTQPGVVPPSAAQLIQTVTAYASTPEPAAIPAGQVAPPPGSPLAVAPPNQPGEMEAARQQLDATSRQLAALLDENWKRYLALPPELYMPNVALNPQNIQIAIARYDDVARRPEYAALNTRPEFQETRRLLARLSELQQSQTTALQLPPPPVAGR